MKNANDLLRRLNKKHRRTHCWVCGSRKGIKTCREANGTRCQKCIKNNLTNDLVEYRAKLVANLK